MAGTLHLWLPPTWEMVANKKAPSGEINPPPSQYQIFSIHIQNTLNISLLVIARIHQLFLTWLALIKLSIGTFLKVQYTQILTLNHHYKYHHEVIMISLDIDLLRIYIFPKIWAANMDVVQSCMSWWCGLWRLTSGGVNYCFPMAMVRRTAVLTIHPGWKGTNNKGKG